MLIYIFLCKKIAACYENVCIQRGLKSEAFNFARHIIIQFVINLFLHNLSVPNSNQSNIVPYLVSFTFKLAKQKMTAKTTYLLLFSDK